MSTAELDALSEAFEKWAVSPRRPFSRGPRLRVWLVFLILRHTGASLGEVLGLSGPDDFDFDQHLVRLSGLKNQEAREVPLPVEISQQIQEALQTSWARAMGEEFFKLDGGYLRWKFYERADECGLPREKANPRALRRTRLMELFNQGLPTSVIQKVMGYRHAGSMAGQAALDEAEFADLLAYHFKRIVQKKTSARNVFSGRIVSLASDGLSVLVTIGTLDQLEIKVCITEESSQRLALEPDLLIVASVKAPQVLISPHPFKAGCNYFEGRIRYTSHSEFMYQAVLTLNDAMELCALMAGPCPPELVEGATAWAHFSPFGATLEVPVRPDRL